MVPFSFFIIVPFAEFALPFVIKFFPNILPSTFATKDEQEEKWKKNVQARMAIADFVTCVIFKNY
jgi:LETM1 and EF-hand domain-containing protein 1